MSTNLNATDLRLRQGQMLHHSGLLDQAELIYREVLRSNPENSGALHMLGVLRAQRGDHAESEKLIRRSLDGNPASAAALSNLGNALLALDRTSEALAYYDQALCLDPRYAIAWNNRGIALQKLDNEVDAVMSFSEAIKIRPDYVAAMIHRSAALRKLSRLPEAIADLDNVVRLNPADVDTRSMRGSLLAQMGHVDRALSDFDTVLARDARRVSVLFERAFVLQGMMRYVDALESYDRILAIEPENPEALNNRGNVLRELGRLQEAVTSYDAAIANRPDYADALVNRGNALAEQRCYQEAAADFQRVLALDPDHEYVRGALMHTRMHCCDWSGFEDNLTIIRKDTWAGKRVCAPFAMLALSESVEELQICARTYATRRYPQRACAKRRAHGNKKIRLGYVSGEFREHATACLLVDLIEHHNKERFELYAFDNGASDRSEIRRRLESAFDRFINISHQTDEEAANAIVANEIDVLVNLNGYFGRERSGVFARRPCSIQVNYLGFPGTLGAPYMDYLIADRFVIPEEERQYYDERIVYLPDTYQPNDSKRMIDASPLSRSAAGLPEDGFVFCSFNNSYKINPEIFDVWMRLLRDVEKSVLWLLEGNSAVADNLRREATRRGVDGRRLVFAPRVPWPEHLARHQLADLFLDTLPCNAHTTASDALQGGLPLVTCKGSTFPGRVAASLLMALEVPELIASSIEEYEDLARRIARSATLQKSLREKFRSRRETSRLFDTARLCDHIESAYIEMVERDFLPYHVMGAPSGS